MERYETVNGIVVKLFNEILDVERNAVITGEFTDITNNDMHIMDAIGIGEPKNMSTVAKSLDVTLGTLTIAVNSLVKKGYVKRERGEKDKRVVFISLLPKGRRAYEHHKKFHQDMIQAFLGELKEDEIEILIKALKNMRDFLS